MGDTGILNCNNQKSMNAISIFLVLNCKIVSGENLKALVKGIDSMIWNCLPKHGASNLKLRVFSRLHDVYFEAVQT